MADALILHPGYSTARVAELSGLTFRQLDYYVRRGLLSPSCREANGSGTRRRWSEADLIRARLVAELRGHGATVEVMACVLAQLPVEPSEWPRYLFVSSDGEVRSLHPDGAVWWGINTERLLKLPVAA